MPKTRDSPDTQRRSRSAEIRWQSVGDKQFPHWCRESWPENVAAHIGKIEFCPFKGGLHRRIRDFGLGKLAVRQTVLDLGAQQIFGILQTVSQSKVSFHFCE